jgi:hypothetical protein
MLSIFVSPPGAGCGVERTRGVNNCIELTIFKALDKMLNDNKENNESSNSN